MAKARRRKDTQFETSMTKSVFLYGSPNKDKSKIIRDMQNEFTKMVNGYIRLLAGNDKFTLQIVKNDKKSSDIRKFEKSIRPKNANSLSQLTRETLLNPSPVFSMYFRRPGHLE